MLSFSSCKVRLEVKGSLEAYTKSNYGQSIPLEEAILILGQADDKKATITAFSITKTIPGLFTPKTTSTDFENVNLPPSLARICLENAENSSVGAIDSKIHEVRNKHLTALSTSRKNIYCSRSRIPLDLTITSL